MLESMPKWQKTNITIRLLLYFDWKD